MEREGAMQDILNYKKNVKKFITSSVLDNIANAIITSSFMVAYGLYIGMNDWMIGILVNLSEISAFFQLFTALLFQKIGESKKSVISIYSLYRIFGYLPILIPFILKDSFGRGVLLLIFMGLSNTFGALAYAPLVNWQMTLVKTEDRGKIEGKKSFIVNILSMVIVFLFGIILDKFTNIGLQYYGFLIMFSVVIVLFSIDIFIRLFTYKPGVKASNTHIKLMDILVIPLKDTNFRKILLYMCVAKMGISLGLQYLSLYQIKYLEINYTFASILSAILSISTAVAYIYIGNRLKDVKWKKILIISYIFLILNYIILVLINKNCSYLLILTSAFYGISMAGIGLFKSVAVYNSSPEDNKIMYVSMYSAISGMMTIIASFVGKYLIENLTFVNPIIFTFLLAIALISIAIIYIYKNIDI